MNIALCDDDTIAMEYLLSLCNEISVISSLAQYTSPEVLLSDIRAGVSFDVVIMDIEFETKKSFILKK